MVNRRTRVVGPGTSCIAVYDPQAPAEEQVCVSSYTYSQDRMYDYPKLGVWGDHYLLSAVDLPDRRFATDRDRLVEFQLVAIDRQGLLDCAGAMRAKSVTVARANDDERYWLALDADGEEPPTAPPTFVAYVDEPGEGQDELHLLSFTPDFTESAQDPTEVSSVPVDRFTSYLCEWRLDCLPQPSTVQGDEGAKLDAVSDRLMNRAAYRQDGDVGRLVLSHTVNVGSPADLAGVRWYQLEYDGSAWSLLQQGTWAPADDVNRFLPSIAMDSAGGIAVAYAVTGPSTSPGARVAGRSPDDPPGELANGEAELVAGEGVRPEDPSWTGDNRWGDYSALTLDPLDGCRFWFTGQYLPRVGRPEPVDQDRVVPHAGLPRVMTSVPSDLVRVE